MLNSVINEQFQIQNNFLRSANLERDFFDSSSLESYVLTGHAVECLKRIAVGCNDNSSQRAWRITGDYGSGKSSFALFLAHWFSGNGINFPQRTTDILVENSLFDTNNAYKPVLITGARESLGKVILLTIHEEVKSDKKAKNIAASIASYLDSDKKITDRNVIDILKQYNSYVIDQGKDGLVLIVDEMGKFLEYAAMNPDQQDIYLLQKLAEVAAGSKDEPFFMFGILHQGFSAYAEDLSSKSAHEWEKVGGRYDELVFSQPIEQLVLLINSALGVKSDSLDLTIQNKFKSWMGELLQQRWFGNATSDSLIDLATAFYPLHPVVAPLLTEIFHRFGQNERSLFSFLLSNERFGLQDISSERKAMMPYRLSDLYDYVKVNLGHKLHSQTYRNNWHVIDSIIESFKGENSTEIEVLKTIGIINLLNDNRFRADDKTLRLALELIVNDSSSEVDSAIERLLELRVIHRRGISGGLCLWPHSSVNLDEAEQKARVEIGDKVDVVDFIKNNKKLSPIVARRHYIQTGNLRAFTCSYCLPSELKNAISELPEETEGHIFIPLCENQEDLKKVQKFISKASHKKERNILWAVPKPLQYLDKLIKDVKCWEYVKQNTPDLNSDKYANEEVKSQLTGVNERLQKRLEKFIDLRTLPDNNELEWFYCGELKDINNGKNLLSFLSDCFDSIYIKAPRVKNELVNRTSISTAAAAARLKLITAILEHGNQVDLGLESAKTPPEKAIYLSLIKEGGIHQHKNSKHFIALPTKDSDLCNILPAMECIDKLMRKQLDSKVAVLDIYQELMDAPYGVRKGIIPILLALYIKINETDVAVYEEGTFLRKVGYHNFKMLVKRPEFFELQYCSVTGVRTDLFAELINMLGIANAKKNPQLLDAVTPLCIFGAELPDYVKKTKRLSSQAVNVREAIMKASSPLNLIFTDLPNACEHATITDETPKEEVLDYVKELRNAISELQKAYLKLQNRMEKTICNVFEEDGKFNEVRQRLAERAEKLLVTVIDPHLKAFVFRLFDDSLAEAAWIESMGSFITSKTPDRWLDSDEDKFISEFPLIAKRFKNAESIAFEKGADNSQIGCRVAVTKASGQEVQQVLFHVEEEASEIKKLEQKLAELMNENPRLCAIAASNTICSYLSQESNNE